MQPPLQIQEEITSPIQEGHVAALQGERRLSPLTWHRLMYLYMYAHG